MKIAYKELVDVAALAGIILLESHAESYRVEDTVRRILALSGYSHTEVISNSTSLLITLDDENEDEPYTIARRISKRGNHLNKIYRVNNISRNLSAGKITLAQARESLNKVNESEYTNFTKDLGTSLMVVSFTLLLGGRLADLFIACLIGGLLSLIRISQEYLLINNFMSGVLATFLTTFGVSVIAGIFPQSLNSDILIIAGLMPLFPGMAFTNGIRDTLKGDYVSGLARIADAFVTAFSIALGVALGLALYESGWV